MLLRSDLLLKSGLSSIVTGSKSKDFGAAGSQVLMVKFNYWLGL